MAKAKTFKTDTGVSIYVPGRPDPIRVNAGEPYETADKAELDALEGCAEVVEVKTTYRREETDG